MVPQNFLFDPNVSLVLDTSVLINLNASGHAIEIIRALPNRIFVLEDVLFELEGGRKNGTGDAEKIHEYVSAGLVEIKKLNGAALEVFQQLVIGSTGTTLDDGESATVAYAVEHHAMAIIDERKAHRICKEQFPSLSVGCTVNLFAHSAVQETLGRETVNISIANALSKARMRVFPEHTDWVIQIVGSENVQKYRSLPRFVRSEQANL